MDTGEERVSFHRLIEPFIQIGLQELKFVRLESARTRGFRFIYLCGFL